MYICNGSTLCKSENFKKGLFICNPLIGKYLIRHGIPLLARENKKMVFSKTDDCLKVLNSLPFYLKLLMKAGV